MVIPNDKDPDQPDIESIGARSGIRISLPSPLQHLTAPITGGFTSLVVLSSLGRGLRVPISDDKVAEAYCHIGRFNRETRTSSVGSTVGRLGSGRLCPSTSLG